MEDFPVFQMLKRKLVDSRKSDKAPVKVSQNTSATSYNASTHEEATYTCKSVGEVDTNQDFVLIEAGNNINEEHPDSHKYETSKSKETNSDDGQSDIQEVLANNGDRTSPLQNSSNVYDPESSDPDKVQFHALMQARQGQQESPDDKKSRPDDKFVQFTIENPETGQKDTISIHSRSFDDAGPFQQPLLAETTDEPMKPTEDSDPKESVQHIYTDNTLPTQRVPYMPEPHSVLPPNKHSVHSVTPRGSTEDGRIRTRGTFQWQETDPKPNVPHKQYVQSLDDPNTIQQRQYQDHPNVQPQHYMEGAGNPNVMQHTPYRQMPVNSYAPYLQPQEYTDAMPGNPYSKSSERASVMELEVSPTAEQKAQGDGKSEQKMPRSLSDSRKDQSFQKGEHPVEEQNGSSSDVFLQERAPVFSSRSEKPHTHDTQDIREGQTKDKMSCEPGKNCLTRYSSLIYSSSSTGKSSQPVGNHTYGTSTDADFYDESSDELTDSEVEGKEPSNGVEYAKTKWKKYQFAGHTQRYVLKELEKITEQKKTELIRRHLIARQMQYAAQGNNLNDRDVLRIIFNNRLKVKTDDITGEYDTKKTVLYVTWLVIKIFLCITFFVLLPFLINALGNLNKPETTKYTEYNPILSTAEFPILYICPHSFYTDDSSASEYTEWQEKLKTVKEKDNNFADAHAAKRTYYVWLQSAGSSALPADESTDEKYTSGTGITVTCDDVTETCTSTLKDTDQVPTVYLKCIEKKGTSGEFNVRFELNRKSLAYVATNANDGTLEVSDAVDVYLIAGRRKLTEDWGMLKYEKVTLGFGTTTQLSFDMTTTNRDKNLDCAEYDDWPDSCYSEMRAKEINDKCQCVTEGATVEFAKTVEYDEEKFCFYVGTDNKYNADKVKCSKYYREMSIGDLIKEKNIGESDQSSECKVPCQAYEYKWNVDDVKRINNTNTQLILTAVFSGARKVITKKAMPEVWLIYLIMILGLGLALLSMTCVRIFNFISIFIFPLIGKRRVRLSFGDQKSNQIENIDENALKGKIMCSEVPTPESIGVASTKKYEDPNLVPRLPLPKLVVDDKGGIPDETSEPDKQLNTGTSNESLNTSDKLGLLNKRSGGTLTSSGEEMMASKKHD